MKARRNGFTSIAAVPILGAAALIVLALVAVIGSAQAAPTTKVYSATVHVAEAQINNTDGTATLRLTLKNESKNTLGSANFVPDSSITPTATEFDTSRAGWTAEFADGSVSFRSTSSAVALTKGQDVWADVPVDFAGCTNAAWTTRAKQSNDFSGNPGNDFALNLSLSNLRPLGSFTFEQIGTVLGGQLYPQIVVSEDADVTVTAYDLCHQVKQGYRLGSTQPGNAGDVASLDRDPAQDPLRLAGAVPLNVTWASGVGSATLTPTVVEAADRLVVTDGVSGISADSDAGDLDDFDVVETICISGGDCHWDSSDNEIHVDASDLPSGASLGIGFKSSRTFPCPTTSPALGDTLIYINPRDYESGETQSVELTYDKTIKGTSGPTTNFSVCISKDNGVNWDGPIADCVSDPPVATEPTPCVQDRARVNGNLVIVLFLNPLIDPLTGAR